MTEFADNGPHGERLIEVEFSYEKVQNLSVRRKKSLAYLRKKRLQRNRQKKEEYRRLSSQERRARLRDKLSSKFKDKVDSLKESLLKQRDLYEKERLLSAYCWKKWKRESSISQQQSIRGIKRINKANLGEGTTGPIYLGKGSFGKCMKMEYRGIAVAVKMFDTFVTVSSVLQEASVINQFDHPGLPLLFGVSVSDQPFMMVTQFHGIDGQCVTLREAQKTKLLKSFQEWTKVFREIAEALKYVHDKGLLHNDVKSDNVVLTYVDVYHPVLIDFGKCRQVENAKLYRLNKQEQFVYKKKYWHIAPELVKGSHVQSEKSDIFSYGVMINSISASLSYIHLQEVSKEWMHKNPEKRPSLTFICKTLFELIQ